MLGLYVGLSPSRPGEPAKAVEKGRDWINFAVSSVPPTSIEHPLSAREGSLDPTAS